MADRFYREPGDPARSPRTEYRVVCEDNTSIYTFDLLDNAQAARNGLDRVGCNACDGPHTIEQRTIYTTPWMSAPARLSSPR